MMEIEIYSMLERLTALETKIELLTSRHNTTEGWFVQLVLMVFSVVVGIAVWSFRNKKRKGDKDE